jgi:hypothetical protein
MTAKRQLITEIENNVANDLARFGFGQNGQMATLSVKQDFLGLVGLNIASHRSDGLVGVIPMVLLECLPLAAAVNRLTGRKAGNQQPSLSTALGYLMPENRFLEWLFDPKEELSRSEVTRMCHAIERYGVPFLNENASLERIIKSLEQYTFSFKDVAMYHLPVAYQLEGEREKARKYVNVQIEELKGRDDLDAREYSVFANKFLSELPES